MLVSEVMTENVLTVQVDRTLRDAARLMLEFDVGSVVVTREGDPLGIVTETDVIAAAYETERPLESIPIEAAMSHPLITVSPEATVRAAVEQMVAEGVKKLPVVDGLELVGVLTHTDLVDAHSLILKEAIHHEERRADWDGAEDGERP